MKKVCKYQNYAYICIIIKHTNTMEIVNKYEKWVENRGNGVRETLRCSSLNGKDFRGSSLSGCNMRSCLFSECDFRCSDFSGCNLMRCLFSECDFRGSNLSGCNLSGCDLIDCDFSGCDFRGSDLRVTDFRGSNLSGCDLRDCLLIGSNLRGCDLIDTDYRHVNFSNVKINSLRLTRGENVQLCKWRITINNQKIIIGCQEATIEEWDKWFAGSEVYQTPRNTEEFKHIYANYLVAVRLMNT